MLVIDRVPTDLNTTDPIRLCSCQYTFTDVCISLARVRCMMGLTGCDVNYGSRPVSWLQLVGFPCCCHIENTQRLDFTATIATCSVVLGLKTRSYTCAYKLHPIHQTTHQPTSTPCLTVFSFGFCELVILLGCLAIIKRWQGLFW